MLELPRAPKGYESKGLHAGLISSTALIVSAGVVLATISGCAAIKEPRKATDQQITNAVDRTFLTDVALHNSKIDAMVSEGIVTLTGTVDNLRSCSQCTSRKASNE